MPGLGYKVVVSKFNQIDGSHYVDPRSNQVFQFDHVRQVASDLKPSGGASDAQRYVRCDHATRWGKAGVRDAGGVGSSFLLARSGRVLVVPPN